MDGFRSEVGSICTGVPQGSVLGPLHLYVIWCDLKFTFLFRVLQAVHAVYAIPEIVKTKVSKPKRYYFLNVKTWPSPPKTANLNTPPCLRHGVGRFSKHCPNVYAKMKVKLLFLL